jgi:hypothetical protein
MSPTSENFYPGPLSVTITDSSPSPTIYYTTNGTPPTTGSTVYTGALSISVTTTVQAIATSSGLATSPIASNTYTLFNNIPVLSTCYQGNSCSPNNQLVVPNTCQQVTQCQYPSGTSPQACNTPDGNGSYVSTWGTSNSAIVTVNSSGLVQSVSAGTANTLSTVYQPSTNTSTPCFQWTWTVTGGTTPGTFGKPVGLRNPWIR